MQKFKKVICYFSISFFFFSLPLHSEEVSDLFNTTWTGNDYFLFFDCEIDRRIKFNQEMTVDSNHKDECKITLYFSPFTASHLYAKNKLVERICLILELENKERYIDVIQKIGFVYKEKEREWMDIKVSKKRLVNPPLDFSKSASFVKLNEEGHFLIQMKNKSPFNAFYDK
ncbi:MAG: hypothetical protein ACOVOR_00040 [Rhabdochlamydiaceae bacterium]